MKGVVIGTLIALSPIGGCARGSDEGSGEEFTVGPPLGVVGAGVAGNAGASGASVARPRGANSPTGNDSSATGSGGAPGGAGISAAADAAGSASMMAAGGTGSAGQPAAGTPATPAPAGSKNPVVPEVTADCPEFRNGTITFMGLGGVELLAGPKPAGPTAPMVFYWHGTGSFSGEYALMATAVRSGVVEEGGALVSFNGTTGGDLLSGTAIFGAGDFELADQLFACAVRNHNVDSRQVFATGCSAGGLFSGAMAAARSNYLAAAAPNSGGWTVPVQFQNDYTPALMTVHGAPGLDVVVVDFSSTSKTADDAFKRRGGFVINCNHGGGHCGGGGLAGDIWKFFKAHPYGVDPEPWAAGLPSGFNGDCEIL